jgi:hypothetical protein
MTVLDGGSLGADAVEGLDAVEFLSGTVVDLVGPRLIWLKSKKELAALLVLLWLSR